MLIPSMNRCAKLTALYVEKELIVHNPELTLKQFIILNKLSVKDRNQTDLAHITDRDKGCLTRLIQALEGKNYVERYTSPNDKRINFVKITPPGLKAMEAAKHVVLKAFKEITVDMEAYEEQLLKQTISKLTSNANALLSKAKTDI